MHRQTLAKSTREGARPKALGYAIKHKRLSSGTKLPGQVSRGKVDVIQDARAM